MEIIIPEVKDIAFYREIVRKINPLELIREALSNNIDVEAKNIIIRVYLNKKEIFLLKIEDDGNGVNLSEIKSFFYLGDSNKKICNIGQKGLGTKIFFRSERVLVHSHDGSGVVLKATMNNQ